MGNTLEAAASNNVDHIVLVSSALVTPKNRSEARSFAAISGMSLGASADP